MRTIRVFVYVIGLSLLTLLGGQISASALPPPLILAATPPNVHYGAVVPLTGTAAPGSLVKVYFHASGQVGYTLRRVLTVQPDGTFSTSYVARVDERFILTDDLSTGQPSGLVQVRPRILSPLITHAPRGSTVVLSGTAAAGAIVVLHFHRQGFAPSDYSIVRILRTSAAGAWSKAFTLNVDYKVFASEGILRTKTVLFTTQ